MIDTGIDSARAVVSDPLLLVFRWIIGGNGVGDDCRVTAEAIGAIDSTRGILVRNYDSLSAKNLIRECVYQVSNIDITAYFVSNNCCADLQPCGVFVDWF